jgi:hypothetical protein
MFLDQFIKHPIKPLKSLKIIKQRSEKLTRLLIYNAL